MTETTTTPAVTFTNVTAALGGHRILDGVALSLPRHGNTAVIGPNGAGKTTLLKTLLGLLPHSGSITFAGDRPRIGYVPQTLDFDAGLPITVLEFICLTSQRLPLWFGVRKKHRYRALATLEQVDALPLQDRRLGALSGGELRRALLAAALARDPDLLVLDEATSGVDANGEALFHRLLDRLRRERGFTQIMVCHNLSLVRRHATRVVCLNRRVVAQGDPEAMLAPAILTRTFIGPDHDQAEALPDVFLTPREASHA